MLDSLNRLRREEQAGPLSLCGTLGDGAQAYAEVLQDWGRISHTGPDGSELDGRSENAGYGGWSTLGENLASGQRSVAQVVTGWMNSPGHRANILEPSFVHLGLGRAGDYWVQKFGAGGTC